MTTKRTIEQCGISGLGIDAWDVVAARRGDRSTLTLRHVWPEDRAAELRSVRRDGPADRVPHVDVYARGGYLVWSFAPRREEA